jgi:hypothetical protein
MRWRWAVPLLPLGCFGTGEDSARPLYYPPPDTGSPGVADGWCEPAYGDDVHDAYPGEHDAYIAATASTVYWAGENFDGYADGALIEDAADRSRSPHIDVTSGTLTARTVVGADTYFRGYTETSNFRMLAVGDDGAGRRVRWTHQKPEYRGYIWEWQDSDDFFAGLHIFGRYQTEYDNYVASLRRDGKVSIKRKLCGDYTTLIDAEYGEVPTRTWLTLRFEVVGNQLDFYIDDVLWLTTTDNTFSWGTTGIRTDHVDVFFDDWAFTP